MAEGGGSIVDEMNRTRLYFGLLFVTLFVILLAWAWKDEGESAAVAMLGGWMFGLLFGRVTA